MIVVDTNIIAYLFVSGDNSELAEKVLMKDSHWAAPLIWRSELRSALIQYVKKGLLNIQDAIEIVENASQLMEDNEYDVNSEVVFPLSKQSNLSTCDCEFIALTNDLGVKLVTADQKIADLFPEQILPLQGFSK